MKKLVKLAVIGAGLGVVGYLVVKKLRNKNEEVEVNEVEENEVVEEAVEVKEEVNDDEYIVADNDEEVEGRMVNDNIEGAVENDVKACYNFIVFILAIIQGHKARKLFKGVEFVEGLKLFVNKYGPFVMGFIVAEGLCQLFCLR